MKYEANQVILIPARVIAVGNVDGSDQQFLDIKFANGAQMTGFDSKHTYESEPLDSDEVPLELQDEKKPEETAPAGKNPDDKSEEGKGDSNSTDQD